MGTIRHLDRNMNEYAAIAMDGYVQSKALAALTAERITIPTGAVAVLFSAQDHFVAKGGDNTVTVAWPVDTDDGTSPELNPTLRRLDGSATHISVMMLSAGVLTATFMKAPS